ncbi:MAG: hypothetical protein LBU45_00890 [Azoarcus sp.]|jgi:hypothetical protein|nr:hypothetical protein [Azoarcus sp.]
MDTSLRLPPSGIDSVQQGIRNQTLAAPREREETRTPTTAQQAPSPSVRVDISDAAQLAARADASPSVPAGAKSTTPPVLRPTDAGPAAPVRTPIAVAGADRAQAPDAPTTAASQEAVKRYTENAQNNLPAGQSKPSTVRVAA